MNLTFADSATPALENAIRALMNTRPLMAACGKRVQVELVKWFQLRQSEGNKQGWPDRNFWYGATKQSVSQNTKLEEVSAAGATVHIDDPRLAFRLRGGTITPKRGDYLALPLTEAAAAAGSPQSPPPTPRGLSPKTFFSRLPPLRSPLSRR